MKKTLVLLTAVLVAVAIIGCNKEPKVDPNVVITTDEVTDITSTSAVSGGEITYDGGKTITAYGVCWATKEAPTVSDNKTEDGDGIGKFTSTITNLEPGTTYYVRAYAVNANGVFYGETKMFSTGKVAPVVTTGQMKNVTFEDAYCGGTVTYNGGDVITAVGICWGTEENPDITGLHTEDELAADGTFISHIEGLQADMTYYVRAYATNSVGTSYGDQISFGTSSEPCTDALADNALQAFIVEHYDANNDGKIQLSEAELVTVIDAPNLGITTIEGLDQYANLVDLRLNGNALTSVDLKPFKKLEIFWGFENPGLTTADIAGLEALKYFHCQATPLAELNLASAVNMTELNLYFTNLSSLDISACAPLQVLNLQGSHVAAIDASGKASLWYLNVRENEQMKSLKVEGCSALKELYADHTSLTELNASNLESLWCIWAFNLKGEGCSINADNCPKLEYLHAYRGEDGTTSLKACSAKNCPALKEYRVFGNPDITSVDFSGSFTNDVALGEINLDGSHLTSLTIGPEQKSLTYLNIHQNHLASINLNGMPNLQYLHCGGATVPTVTVTNCPNLVEAYMMNNSELTGLDFTGCPKLRVLWCFENAKMASLYVNDSKALYYLDAHQSPIDGEVKFEDMPDLWFTVLWSTQVKSAVYKNVPALQHINFENAPIASLSITGASRMNGDADINLNVVNTKLVTLDVTGAPNLRSLAARDIPTLTTLNLTANPGLINLWSWNTAQTSLDLRGCADAMNQIWVDANPSLTAIYMRSAQTIADFHHDAAAEVIIN